MSFINSASNIFFQKFSFRFSRGSTKGDDVWTDRPCCLHVILNIERIFDEISFFSFFHFFIFSFFHFFIFSFFSSFLFQILDLLIFPVTCDILINIYSSSTLPHYIGSLNKYIFFLKDM